MGGSSRPDDRGAAVLLDCARCRCPWPQPRGCAEAGNGRWELTTQCPNCFEVAVQVLDDEGLDTFEDRMEAEVDALVGTLRIVGRANMVEDVNRFIAALAADALLPADF